MFVFTTPTTIAKPILELFTFRMGILSETEIRGCTMYFSREALQNVLNALGFHQKSITHSNLQIGLNKFVVAGK